MMKIIQVLTFREDGKTFTLHDGYLALTALQQWMRRFYKFILNSRECYRGWSVDLHCPAF